ncbi:MAG: SulP family inorganic anion transporter [Deltaproteobacteria bacterium]|nr:SulP family inorganic anion transporter [Deltaproteobacteria bacterium]
MGTTSKLLEGSGHPSASGTRTDLSPFRNLRHDAPAAVVVFLVALPLCLGIALASGAPLMAGLITGIVGGLLVSWLSGSPLSVSGPAAGLTVVVLSGIETLGSYEVFLMAVALSGIMQIGLGVIRAGIIAYYFPSNVIKGLLAGIGCILILKQIPHAVGFDADFEGDLDFLQPDGRNTFTEIPYALGHFNLGAVIIAAVGLLVVVLWARSRRLQSMRWLPGPLVVVTLGILLNEAFYSLAPSLANTGDLLVNLGEGGLLSQLRLPDFSQWQNPDVYTIAATIAAIGSVETLLCVEAVDKLDPFKRSSNTNRELRAQGIGNFVAGMIGGIPMTAVIVRGSANVQSGGRTRMSAFLHSVLLVVAVLAVPWLLVKIPLAALAAVLLHVGYKLAPVSLFVRMYRRGWEQFIPFMVTILAILFSDLLKGVAIGMACAVFYILRANLATPYFMHSKAVTEDEDKRVIHIELSENVTFLNKASVNRALQELPDHSVVEIDGSHATYIDRDVLELIEEFREAAPLRGIGVSVNSVPTPDSPASERALGVRNTMVDAARKDDLRRQGDTIVHT